MHCYMIAYLVKNILQAAAFMGSVFLFLLEQDSKQTAKTRIKYHVALAINLCKCHISSDYKKTQFLYFTRNIRWYSPKGVKGREFLTLFCISSTFADWDLAPGSSMLFQCG